MRRSQELVRTRELCQRAPTSFCRLRLVCVEVDGDIGALQLDLGVPVSHKQRHSRRSKLRILETQWLSRNSISPCQFREKEI